MVRVTAILLFLALGAGAPPPAGDVWREAPEYLPLFAPAGARGRAYRTYVSRLDLDVVLRRLSGDPALLTPPGAWRAQPLLPLDAFGQTGRYDRGRLVRLYGARRPRVARGPAGQGSEVTEAWSLVSPYPDPALQRLEPGTLLIVLSLGGS